MEAHDKITIFQAIDDVESARIAMGAMFDRRGNANDWGECVFFCAMRDMLCTIKEQLEDYKRLHEQQEARKSDKGE